MPRQVDHRSTLRYPADQVYAAIVDPEYLRARLGQIGGPRAEVLDHSADAQGAHYRLRHGLDAKDMPAMLRGVLPGDISVERAESWKRVEPGRYDGETQVTVPGAPASAAGGMRLHGTDGAGSELRVRLDVTVNVPLLGSTIEGFVAGQVEHLLGMESQFMQEWLARKR
jgi:hypothetical protein